jgi:ABC-type branched-subunit amino acid transport system substrate-binding protein
VTTLAFNLSSFSPSWTTVYSAGDADKQTRPMASFIKNVLGETDKVGIIWVRDPLDDALRGALADELPKEGLRVVREEGVVSGQGSFVAELNRLRDAGATSVALFVSMTEVLGILRDAKALGYAPNWTGSYWPSDETTAAGSALFQGIKVIRSYATTNSEAYATYHAKAEKYGRRDVVNSTTMSLYGMGLIVGTVIENAGDQPATGSFGPAIEQLVNYDNQTFLTLTFGPGVHIAQVGMYPAECCNDDSTWRGIGPARTRF